MYRFGSKKKSSVKKLGRIMISGKMRQIYENENGEFFRRGITKKKVYLKTLKKNQIKSIGNAIMNRSRGRRTYVKKYRKKKGRGRPRGSRSRRRSSRRRMNRRSRRRSSRRRGRRSTRRRGRRSTRRRKYGRRFSFGSFGGGRPSTLLGMEGPYM